jgi:phage I-like protein
MTSTPAIIALASQGLPDADAPEWVHLLPIQGGKVLTRDPRGPYTVPDVDAVIAASMAEAEGLLIDENHVTDAPGNQGREAPARGWIKEMQARADGIWGRVEWNAAGRALLAERAYRRLSPVIRHLADKKIIQIIGASLTNRPNLVGITALNTENAGMSWDKIAKALGLADGAGEEDILTAIGKMATATAAQSALAEVGTALGVANGDSAAIVAAAKAAKAGDTAMTALQAELKDVSAKLVALQTEGARDRAAAFVDGAIKRGHVGVKPLRDHYIARHMADAAAVEKEIGAMPVIAPGALPAPAKVGADGAILSLNAEQAQVAAALGISQADYLKTLNAEKGVLA